MNSDAVEGAARLRVLDLFCGRGGWSRPFVEDGDEVVGIDIEDFASVYPGKFVQADITKLDGREFAGIDLIIGSPPCREFSVAGRFGNGQGRYHWKVPQDPARGMVLVREFKRIVEEAKPQLWAMENVTNGEPHINRAMGEPSYHFRLSVKGFRSLWSSFPIPFADEYAPDDVLMKVKQQCHGKPIVRRKAVRKSLRGAERAEIPYPIARFIANTVKSNLQTATPPQRGAIAERP